MLRAMPTVDDGEFAQETEAAVVASRGSRMSKKEDSVRRPVVGRRVALAQVSPVLGDVAANLEQHRAAVEKAAAEGCDLLVFPELSLAGYRLKDSVPDVAVRRDSDVFRELEQLSTRVGLVVGFVEETPEHLFYNAAAYFEDGRCVAVHRKSYLPTYGMFEEQRHFARGRSIAAFDTKCGRVAILVCEDMLHPSAVTVAACDGATLIVVPSASPARGVTDDPEVDSNARSWEAYNRVMARTFGCWVAYCNRVGVEDGVTFWGGSEIVSPAGETVVKAPYYEDGFVSTVVSDDAVRRRRIASPTVRDEDMDLTINDLSRIRGRAVETAKAEAAKTEAVRDGERPAFSRSRPRFDDGPRDRGDRDRGDRDRGDRDRGDRDAGDRPRPPFRDRGGDEGGAPRGRFGGPPRDRGGFDGPPRGRFGDGPPRGRFDGPPRDRDGDGPPRGRFGDGPPRGRFGGPPRDGDGPPRGRFGDGPPRPRFGDGPPRGRFGDGPPRPRFGDGPPRGRFGDGPPRPRRDDAGPGGFGDDRPRERQRPERAGKPFGKPFAKPFGKPGGKPAGKPFAKPFGKGAPRKRRDD